MRVIKKKYKNRESGNLLKLLKNKVFHLTTQTAYAEILKSQKVLNNKNGDFNINTSSEKSFGRSSGYLCLFDLREKSTDEINNVLYKYNFLKPLWFIANKNDLCELNLAYMLLDPKKYEKLITYEDVKKIYGTKIFRFQIIPYFECWIEEQIPIEWFSEICLIKMKVPLACMLKRLNL